MVRAGDVLLTITVVCVVALGLTIVSRVRALEEWVELHEIALERERVVLENVIALRRDLHQLFDEVFDKAVSVNSLVGRARDTTRITQGGASDVDRARETRSAAQLFNIKNVNEKKNKEALSSVVQSLTGSLRAEVRKTLDVADEALRQFVSKKEIIDELWPKWFDAANNAKNERLDPPPAQGVDTICR